MSRTNARWEADQQFADAYCTIAADTFNNYGAGAAARTRNAKGNISFNVAASQVTIFSTSFEGLLFRTGYVPFLQEQFGTAAGVAGPTAVANTSDPDAQIGVPPFLGTAAIQSGLVPQLGFIPKGIKFLDITLKYVIGTNPLALHTIGLSKSVFANNAAIVVTDILAPAANGLATAAQANPYVTKVTLASPTFQVTDLADLWLEIAATTPVGGTYQLFGATVHLAYNLA